MIACRLRYFVIICWHCCSWSFPQRHWSVLRNVKYPQHYERLVLHSSNVQTSEERILLQRGIVEESLMSWNQSPLLQQQPNSKSLNPLDCYLNMLRTDGVVRIDTCLSDLIADSLRRYVLDLESRSLSDFECGKLSRKTDRFARVLLSQNRSDLKLPLGPDPIMAAIQQLLIVSSVGKILQRILGPKSTLYECSCLISHPGSVRQNIHPDHPFHVPNVEDDQRPPSELRDPMVITAFVALQDIHRYNGPTFWIPGTHTANAHDRFQRRRVEDILEGESPKDHLLRTTPNVVGYVPKGSCILFDSRVLHCGTANTSPPSHTLDNSRALFYVSFLHPKVRYPGNEGSIGYGLENASLTLEELMHPELRDKNKPPWEDLYHFP